MSRALGIKERLNKNLRNKVVENPIKKDFIKKMECKIMFTDEIKLNDFLRAKVVEVTGLQLSTSLELGKLFQEVSDRIGRNGNGLYCRWLEAVNFNRMTANRHRQRYKLYRIMKTDVGREAVAKLRFDTIAKICNLKDESKMRARVLRTLNRGEEPFEILEAGEEEVEVKRKFSLNLILDLEFLDSAKEEELNYATKILNKKEKEIKKARDFILNKKIKIQEEKNRHKL